MLKENLEEVEEKIAKACERAGRAREEVTLIAVSKTKPVEMLQEIYDEGIRDFGENKVQELTEKYEVMPKDMKWHMIGHLQRNKVKYIVDKVTLIHSVDSLRLAETISREAEKKGVTVPILIEVNIAGEESKFGVKPEEAEGLIREIAKLPSIAVKGLMTIAPYVENADWLLCEAFCLYEDREVFQPYKKHHSTALDAGRLAAELGVKNLVLYHTEDRNLDTRKQSYMREAAQAFSGTVYVPDDLERINI